ncbi:hypothetical protein SAMN05661093_07730 [Kibdelosporangium aridum]|uniref:Secretory lipase n=1 Tax=Kibdelosporangium aridum TaxID=2030 RepID=A0A1W2FLW1_KIBAR|nr:hypothetical protein SAMN05661093_07730 [Kibdelosporangium aridum]
MRLKITSKAVVAVVAAMAMSVIVVCTSAGAQPESGAVTLAAQKIGPPGTGFWTMVPEQVPSGAKPGDVLWVQRRTDAPRGARGWNVVYVSEIQPGLKKYVSGQVFAPNRLSTRPRDVVLWNHPTAGMTDDCAPSRQTLNTADPDLSNTNVIPAIQALTDADHLVLASDYPGLGLAGPEYYMQAIRTQERRWISSAPRALSQNCAHRRSSSNTAGHKVAKPRDTSTRSPRPTHRNFARWAPD